MPAEVSQQNSRIFITDCEGPISKNDNAFELTNYFIPSGDKFFALISKYDDVLAEVLKKPGYKAGDTLRLILPFLKAYGATNKKIREYSSENVILVPGAQETLQFVNGLMSSFIVSTSYEQYIFSLCQLTGFPFGNTCCTRLNLDEYTIDEEETNRLCKLRGEIVGLPMITIPEGGSVCDFSERDQETLRRLDEIFWDEIVGMESGRMLREVNPIGGSEKAKSVQDIVKKLDSDLECVMYVGDSITDVQPLRLVRENGGLAVSFNGNDYAVRESGVAVLSGNTVVTSVLVESFSRVGKNQTLKLVEEWSLSGLQKYRVNFTLQKQMSALYPDGLPKVERITSSNMERLKRESSLFRKSVRGETIGKLG
jgi:energy-converting hydrogenase A subunit R